MQDGLRVQVADCQGKLGKPVHDLRVCACVCVCECVCV
jgi:hypothetical protein